MIGFEIRYGLIAVKHGNQLPNRFEAHFIMGQFQRGQRWFDHISDERLIVDANHRHVGSDAHSAFSRSFIDEGGAHIVETEDAVRLDFVEYPRRLSSSVGHLQYIDDQRLIECNASFRKRTPIAIQTLPLRDNSGCGTVVNDASASGLNQTVGGIVPGHLVIRVD